MAVYVTNTSELTSIANAIRTKGGTSASLEWPTGFISAISNMEVSSGGTDISDTTATASDVLSGKYFYNASGTKTEGSIVTKTSSDLSASGDTVTVPAGYYASQVTKAVSAGSSTAPASINGTGATLSTGTNTLTLSKTVSVTPTVSAGYISTGTAGDSAVSLTANVNIRDASSLSASGKTVTVPAGYYSTEVTKSVDTMTLPTSAASSATSGYTSKATISRSTSDQYINIPTGYNEAGAYYKVNAVANGSTTAPASISGTSATVSTGTGTLTLTKTISVTPTVSAGYISSGTAGNSDVSLTASVTINPTLTVSGATVTAPAGYYSADASQSVTTMTLPTTVSASATSGYTSKATVSRSTSNQYINIPPGYNSAGGYYTISAVPNGSATGPSSLSGTSATLSTGTNTITLTKTGVTTTPTVNAGYVSSATASTATITLTASVTTKAAATITPSTSDQTIASGTYLTGTQTISGDADLVASNIKTGVSIFGVTGTYTADATADATEILSGETAYVNGTKLTGSLTITTVYVGSAAPSASTGINGDIYIKS